MQGLTDEEIAKKCHLSRSTINRLRKGTSRGHIRTILKISKAHDVEFLEQNNNFVVKLKKDITLEKYKEAIYQFKRIIMDLEGDM